MKSWTYFRFILILFFLGACSRNPLGEDLQQPILNLGFLLSQNCTNNFNQDSPYNCQITTSEVITGVTYSIDPILTTCAWASIDVNTGIISGTPDDEGVGVCQVVVNAQNSMRRAQSYPYLITVNNLPAVFNVANAAPVFEDTGVTVIRNDAAVQASEEGMGTYSLDNANATVPRCSDNAAALTVDPNTGAVSFGPAPDYQGTCNIRVAFDDGNGAANSIVTSEFTINVININDAPVIAAIANQVTNVSTPINVNMNVTDIDSALSCSALSLSTSSSNPAVVVSPADISFSGTVPNCVMTINPQPAVLGSTTITVTVTDGTLNDSTSFLLDVLAIPQPPVLLPIANQNGFEDTPLVFAIDASDPDTVLACNGTFLSATSSNPALLPVANIAFSGVIPNCTVTLTPTANNSGSSNITITLVDGTGFSVNESFTATFNAVNDVPTITGIANQTVNEDTATSALAFTIGDLETGGALTCAGSVAGTSSNPAIIPNGNIVVTGVAPNCSVVVTPAANQNGGPVTITLTVTDSGTPLPVQTAQTTFDVTVNAVNDAPTITGIANQTINEDTPTAALAFTIGDVETAGALACNATSITATSSNQTIIPDANLVLGGAAPNCTVTVNPALNQNGGPVTITLVVADTGLPLPVLTAQTTFDVTVTAINDAPTITGIANQTINEDTATAALAFTIGDVETAGALNCATSVVATSSNTTIIPNANLVLGGTAPNCTVVATPALNQSGGPVTITLVVSDTGLPLPIQTSQTTFDITVNAVNDVPTITGIANQTINEDTPTAALAFTIGDTETGGALNCSTSVVATSSNQALIPDANLVLGGVAPNCTITATPLLNQNGGPVTITLVVSDTGLPLPIQTAQTTFDITVNAINDVPTITGIANQTINEDNSTAALAFTIGDIETSGALACNATSITATSSNTTIIPNGNIVVAGAAPNCTVTVTPALNQNGGPVTITLVVTDSGTPLPVQTAQTIFDVTVTPVNDAPTISPIADQNTDENLPFVVNFVVSDVDNVVTCSALNLSATSSNPGVIPVASIVFGGTIPNCTATLTPVSSTSGVTNIVFTVDDNGVPNLQATEPFQVTVAPVNDAPVLSFIGPQTVNEDGNVVINFTITDIDSPMNCTTSMSAATANAGIVPVPNIVFGGAAPNCTATVTPVANANGVVNLTFTVTDAGMPIEVDSETFALTVNAINDVPTIAAIANQTINEDTPTASLPFTIGDLETGGALTCAGSVAGVSSNTTIIPNANIVVTGTAPNCNVVVTPALNQNGGPVTITLTVTDTGTPMPAQTAQTTFDVTVTAINDVPTISSIVNQTVNEDTATASLPFTIGDLETGGALTCAGSVAGVSSNTTIIPNGNIVVTGTAPNCNVVVTPALNENGGPVTITLTVTDTGTPMPAQTAQSVFTVTVNAINDVPTISGIANQTINEDTPTASLPFTIGDTETGGALTCAGSVAGVSSNTTIIPNGNIVVTGTAPNCNVVVTPALNQNGGPVTITLTVTDTGTPMPVQTAQTTFDVTVTAINDVPTISSIVNQTINEDTPTASLPFTIGDTETGGALTCAGSVAGVSSNTTIIPNGNIVVTGTAPNCNVVVTPALNQNGGPVTITLTVTDTGTPMPALTAQTTFDVTVTAINDAPTIDPIANQTVNEDTPTASLPFNIGDTETGGALTCAGSVAGVSSNTTIIPNGNIVVTGTAPNCNVVVTPALNQNGGPVTITLTVTDTGTPMPAQTAQSIFTVTVNAVNDVPTISGIANQTINEDNSTAALAFTIGDLETGGALNCATSVAATSSNQTIIPDANLVLGGVAPNCTVTATPALNQNGGPVTITLVVTDSGTPLPAQTAQTTYTITVNPVNDAPVLGAIANQSTPENTPIVVNFTFSDIDNVVTCSSLNLSATSSNPAVVTVPAIVFGGTLPNCTATITPVASANGISTIVITADDNGVPNLQHTTSFDLTVTPFNDPPVIDPIAGASTPEDVSTLVNFTINDIDNTLNCTTSVTASTNNAGLVPVGNVIFGGTAPNCTATITPVANANGTVDLTFTVADTGTPIKTDAQTFTLTVNAVNDVPTIGSIANQTVNEDTPTASLPFAIGDIETGGALTCAGSVAGVSSNTTIIPNGNIVVTGTAPNCNVVVTPVLNQNGGPVTITLTVTDTGTPMPAQTAQSIFTVTVNAINDAPTIDPIANQTVNEDTATASLPFTIGDVETGGALTCAGSVAGVSSNTTIIPNGNIVVAGTAPNCNVVVTPAANQNGGPVTITLTVTDTGTPMPAQTAQSIFTVTVNAINDVPTIDPIANQTVNEDTPTASLPFTIGDLETGGALTCAGSVAGVSSNTTIIPNGNIVITGTAPNCNVVVTPALNQNGGPVTITLTVTDTGTPMPAQTAQSVFTVTVTAINDVPTIGSISNQTVNEDTATASLPFTIGDVETGGTLTCAGSVAGVSSNTTIIPNGNIVITGTAPNCNVVVTPALNQNGGPVTITLTVTDTGTPMPAQTAQSVFTVTVNAMNDAPTIDPIANQTINEDSATASLPFTIGDTETGGALTCAGSVAGISSNTTIIPNGNIVVTGTAPNCNVVVTPAANQNGGPVTITLTVTDTGTPMPAQTAQSVFTVTVTAINDAPTIAAIANQTINEDTPTASLPFTIGDLETGGALTCAGSVAGVSSNTTIIPNGNIVVTGTAPNCNVVVTPALNQSGGPVTITLTVTDTGTPMPAQTAQSVFTVTVTAINDAPTISAITNQTINEDTPTASLPFTIGDTETGGALTCAGSVAGVSSNTTIIPNGNIVVTGTAPNCNVVVTPALNENGGPVTITLTVTDTGTPMPAQTAQSIFTVTVTPVNDAPVINVTSVAPYTTNEDNSLVINFDITDVDNTLNCTSSMTGNTSTPALIAVAGIVFGGTAPNCTATINPQPNQSGSANLVFRVTDAGALFMDTSSLTVTVNPVNDAPTISAIGNQTVNEDTATGALPFTIGDIDNVLLCTSANVSVNSSNTTLVLNASIVIGGTYPNCTVTVTPELNQSGTSTITLTVNDNGTPNLQAVSAFTLTVNAVNDAPTITGIANQTINEDANTGALAFTIGDIETGGALTCAGSVVGTSSNLTLIPNGNIVVTGVAPNCNVVVTPAANQNGGPVTITLTVTDSGTPLPVANNNTTFDVTVSAVDDPPVINPISAQVTNKNTAIAVSFTISDIDSVLNCSSSMAMSSTNTTLVPNTNVVFSGAVPNCTATITPANLQFGVTDITLTVSDGTSPDSETFQLTVNDVDLPPTISTLTNRTVNEDGAAVASPNQNPLAVVIPFVVNFTIDDVDSGLNCVTSMQANSSNAAVVPNGNVVFGGTYPNCTATITLVANSNTTANGATSIAFEVHDATTTVSSNAFTLTVTAVNDRPTVTGATNQSTNEDTPITVFYTINDIDSVINCTTSITVNIPAPAPTVTAVKAGTYPNCQATFTPAANAFGGPKNITFIANDGLATGQQSFQLTILAVNDAPTISAIPPTSFPSGVPTDVAFTIGDVEAPSPNCTTSMSASTSNPAVIPLGNIVFSGNPSYPNCKATVTAATTGTSDLIFTVTDSGGLPTSSSPSTMTSLTAGTVIVSQSLSTVTVTANSSIASNKAFTMPSEVVTITVTARDTNNVVLGGGHWVVIQKAGGTSDGILSAVTDNNDGTYTATFSGTVTGSERTFNAFIDGYPLASALPTVTVGSRGPNCLSYKNAGYVIDGIYALDTDGDVGGNAPFNAYCDMTTNGGGWTLAAVPRKGVIPFAEASGLLSPATVTDSRNTNIWFAASSFEFSQMRLTNDAAATQFSIADFKESKSIANLLSTYSVYSQSNVVLGSASANSSVVSNIGSTCFVVRGKSAASAPWADSADYMFMGFHGGAGCSVPINSGNNWDRTNITQQWLVSGYDGLGTVDGPEGSNSNVGQNLTGTDWVSQDSATLIWFR